MSNKITAYDNTVLGEGGYSDAGEIDLSKVLTGEDTSSTLIDTILPGLGAAGLLAKTSRGKWMELIPKSAWNKIFGSKVVDKMPEGVKQLALAVKGKIKDGQMVADPGFKYGMIGKPKKTVETITPKQVDKFIKKEATTNLPLTGQTPAASKWNIENVAKTKDASEKFSLTDPIVPSLLIPILYALDDLNNTYGWSNKMASLLRPDPDMGTKEQHDEDMINLLYSLKDNPKPEAKGQRLEDSLPNQININEILMRKLYEQINKNKIQDEQDEEISYPSKGYGALF